MDRCDVLSRRDGVDDLASIDRGGGASIRVVDAVGIMLRALTMPFTGATEGSGNEGAADIAVRGLSRREGSTGVEG